MRTLIAGLFVDINAFRTFCFNATIFQTFTMCSIYSPYQKYILLATTLVKKLLQAKALRGLTIESAVFVIWEDRNTGGALL